jgi:hypothetical protein
MDEELLPWETSLTRVRYSMDILKMLDYANSPLERHVARRPADLL